MIRKSHVAVGIVGAAIILTASRTSPRSDAEIGRIRAHFDSVLVELGARDISALTREQRDGRSRLIETLAAYRDRGAFPRNYDFAAPTPYFVDRKTGVLCAVAHLMASTGRRDIVDRVAAADNNVWVPQLAGDTAFQRWLDLNGLTVAEAARIQVPYIGDGPSTDVVAQRDGRITPMPVAMATLAAVAGATNVALNRDGHSAVANILGMASGAASAGVGISLMATPRANRGVAITSMALGTASALIAGHGMWRHRQALAASRAAERDVAITPIIPTSENAAGLSVSVRF